MEEEYHRFQQGKFGITCEDDKAKRQLEKYKTSIRRLSSTEPDTYWRQIYYLRHRRCLAEIDNAEPKFTEVQVPTAYALSYDQNRFNRAQYLQSKIDRENALLLSDIHKLNQRKPEFENANTKYLVNFNWKKRIFDTFRIGMENCTIYNRLKEIKPKVPSKEEYARWYENTVRYRIMRSRFPPYWNTRLCAPFEEVAWKRALEVPRPVVYLDIEIFGKGIGRVGFELRADLVPMTVENFRSLCTGDRGKSYRCTEINHIRDGLFWQGGSGLISIYGETFPIENYKIKHDAPGILSMVSFGEKTTNSEFRISARALPPMDNKQVAIGKVILGLSFLKKMGKIAGVTENGKPKIKIVIIGCGETTEEGLMDIPPPDSIEAQRINAELKLLGIDPKPDEDVKEEKTKDTGKPKDKEAEKKEAEEKKKQKEEADKKKKEEAERKKKQEAYKKWDEKFGMVEYEPIPVRRSYTDINVRVEDQGQQYKRSQSSGALEGQSQDEKKKSKRSIKVEGQGQEPKISKSSLKAEGQGQETRKSKKSVKIEDEGQEPRKSKSSVKVEEQSQEQKIRQSSSKPDGQGQEKIKPTSSTSTTVKDQGQKKG